MKVLIAILFCALSLSAQTVGGPLLPQAVPSVVFPGEQASVLTPANGAALTTALTGVACGTTIRLAHGVTYSTAAFFPLNTNCTCRSAGGVYNNSQWIIIESDSYKGGSVRGNQLDPSMEYAQLAYISSTDTAAFGVAASAGCYWLLGLDIFTTGSVNTIGMGCSQCFSIANFPHDMVVDHSYVHGLPTTNLQRCVSFGGNWLAAVDSYISDCHSTVPDSQGVFFADGSGPYLLQNNFISGSTENTMAGGAPINALASDITIRKNHYLKPLAWRLGDPSYAGIHQSVKDLIEFKLGQRVLVTANVFDQTWQDGQDTIFVFNPGCSNTTAAFGISDVTVTLNLFRHGGAGFLHGGCSDVPPPQPTRRVLFQGNLWQDIDNCKWAACGGNGNNFVTLNPGGVGLPHPPFNSSDIWVIHETYYGDNMGSVAHFNVGFANTCFVGNFYYGSVYRDSIAGNATSPQIAGPGGQCDNQGDAIVGDFLTTTANWHNNCWYNTSHGSAGNMFTSPVWTGVLFPAAASNVFVNPGVDFHVAASSVCHNAASDGTDMGANIDAVNAATSGVVQTLANTVTVTNVSPSTFTHNGSTSITITGTNFLAESALGVIIGGAGPTSAISTNSCGFGAPGQFTITTYTDSTHIVYTGGCTVVLSAPLTAAVNDTINVIVNSAQTSGTINRYSPGNACTSVMVTNSTTITCTTPAASGAVTTGPVSAFVSQWGIPVQSTVFPSYN